MQHPKYKGKLLLLASLTSQSVIAFPKTSTGVELMTGSPSEVETAQLDDLFIRVKE
jgi:aspartyl-tRNA synthetase